MLKKSFLWNMAFEICKYMNQLNTFIYIFFFFLAKHIQLFEGCEDLL